MQESCSQHEGLTRLETIGPFRQQVQALLTHFNEDFSVKHFGYTCETHDVRFAWLLMFKCCLNGLGKFHNVQTKFWIMKYSTKWNNRSGKRITHVSRKIQHIWTVDTEGCRSVERGQKLPHIWNGLMISWRK